MDTEYFARSLLDWGATAGRALAFGGPDPKVTVYELLSSIITDEPTLSQQLVEMNVVTLGDLTEITEVDGQLARRWVSKKKLRGAKLGATTEDTDRLVSILDSIPVPNGPITIRVGTCLIPAGPLTEDVLEFLGWVEGQACVRR